MLLPVSGEGEVEGDDRPVVIRMGGDDVGELTGDPERMVAAMIASVDVTPAPRRLTMGSHAYASIHAALGERMARLEAQKALAFATDLKE